MQIRVRNQAGDEVTFKVKPETKFGKIFEAYAGQKGIDVKAVTFQFDGTRVKPDETPKMLEVSRPFHFCLLHIFLSISTHPRVPHSPRLLQMEDNDLLDVVLMQVGGGERAPSFE